MRYPIKQLSQLCDIVIGRTPARKEPEYWGKGNKWVSISDLTSKVVCDTKEEITDYAVKQTRCRIVPKGTLLFSFKLTIGKMAFAGCDLYTNEAIAALHIKDKKELYAEYLFFALKVAKLLGSNQAVMGKTLNSKSLAQIEIPLPPLDDQKRIAHLLGKVEGLIARRKQHLKQLGDLLKSVFLEMFGEFLKDDSDSTLADCLKIQQGFAFKSSEFIEDGVPIIKIGTVNKGFFDYSTLSFIAGGYPEKIRRYEIVPGDLLISLTGTVGKDDYGNTCFVPNNPVYTNYLLNQRVGKLICDKRVANPYFIDAFITLPKVKSALIKQNRGIRQANLSNSDIYDIPLSIPPIDLQNQFAAIVEKVEGLKSRYQQSLADLEILYGALSQKAFKGDLDLSRIPLTREFTEVLKEEVHVVDKLEIKVVHMLPAPPDLAVLSTVEGRKKIIGHWLKVYLDQLGDTPFSARQFMDAAQQRLLELAEDETPEWGAAEYDELKAWVFEALECGRIEQTRNTIEINGKPAFGNQIILKKAQ